jgi:outer membrane protein assembly factor BamB
MHNKSAACIVVALAACSTVCACGKPPSTAVAGFDDSGRDVQPGGRGGGAGSATAPDAAAPPEVQGSGIDAGADITVPDQGRRDAEPEERFSGCIEDWPTSPIATKQLSLAVTPRVLWRAPLIAGPLQHVIAVTTSRVAVSVFNRLAIFDRKGTVVKVISGEGGQVVSSPVADRDENFYFGDASFLHAVDKDGNERWRVPLGTPQTQIEFLAPQSPLLSPDGMIYLSGVDGQLWAVQAANGGLVYHVMIGVGGLGVAKRVTLGVGNTLFLSDFYGDGSTGIRVLKRATGASRGFLLAPDGWRIPYMVMAGFDIGMVVWGRRNTTDSSTNTAVLDRCGKVAWSVSGDHSQPAAIAYGDDLVVRDDPAGADANAYALRRFTKVGSLVGGPVSVDLPVVFAVGADDTINVSTSRRTGNDVATTVRGLGPQLKSLWAVELGKGEYPAAGALADGGVLFIVRRALEGADQNELVAVQTTSPGPAAASWPQHGHDARGTAWLSP